MSAVHNLISKNCMCQSYNGKGSFALSINILTVQTVNNISNNFVCPSFNRIQRCRVKKQGQKDSNLHNQQNGWVNYF